MSNIAAITYDCAVAVTKSDTVNDPNVGLTGNFAGLYVASTGTVAFVDSLGNTVTIGGTLLAGQIIPIRCVRVKATGTSATVLGMLAIP